VNGRTELLDCFIVDFKADGCWQTYGHVNAATAEDAVHIVLAALQRLKVATTECVAALPKQYDVTATQHFSVEATSAEAATDQVKGTRISDAAKITARLHNVISSKGK
jgi:carbon starvation protein CstA